MGLLDSPYVGQLVKKGTVTATLSSNGYIGSGLDVSMYNTVSFYITINSGSLDGDSSYIDFRGNVISSNYQALYCYPLTNNNIGTATRKLTSGKYCSEDISAFNNGGFYMYTSSEVSVTIDYVLCTSTFQDILNGMKIDTLKPELTSIKTLVQGLTVPREKLLYTFTNLDLSSVASHNSSAFDVTEVEYSAIRINIVFNQADENVAVTPLTLSGSFATGTGSVGLNVLRQDGTYTNSIKADGNLRFDYYLDYIPAMLNMRCNTAGASGLTATIKIYAITKDAIPAPKHIQDIYKKTVALTTSEQTFECTLPSYMCMFKFFYCYVGKSYNKTGTVSKNYVTSDEDDSDTLLSFTSKKIAVTKWLPVTAIEGAKITFKVTGASTGNDTIAIYGVV